MTAPIIHIVDDDASFRTAIARLLRASGYDVALYESGDQLANNPPGSEPGCILLDVQMAGLDGLQLQDRLATAELSLPIVFVTGQGDIPMSVRAIKAGADDFLSKPVSKQTLLPAIENALARYREHREHHNRLGALRSLLATLTPRERQVFDLVVRGKLNKQIAYQLGAAERTIKAHRQKIMEKLRTGSVAELVSVAERLGLGAACDDRPA
jgi:RNA polymerase sigma factor (sigma-70 family)